MHSAAVLPLLVLCACRTDASPSSDTGTFSDGGRDAMGGAGAAGAGPDGAGDDGAAMMGFVHAKGPTIVDGRGNPLLLRGVSFGNQVWSNAAVPDDHGEVDFGRLATMGANSTRFLMNYLTFEDDSAPYVYKQAGWDWIDQNVVWAKAHGIYLILNMHVPEGGFQSNGGGGALWTDSSNQDRLVALWKAIATRYAGEPAVAAFDLVNEPQPLVSSQQWQDLASRITAAIRSVDTQHMVIVERTNAVAGNYGNDANMNLFTVNDANAAYEFHFYDPTDYTFQLQPWNNTPDGGVYPDETKITGVTEAWINLATFDAPTAPAGTSDWTYYQGTRITASNPAATGSADGGAAIAVGKPTLQGQALGAGTIAFDDLSISEYDANGTFVREVEHIYPTSSVGWYFWSNNGSGTPSSTSSCKTSATCLTITGSTDDASYGGTGYYFLPKQGYEYGISGWMKGTSLPASAVAHMRIDLLGSSSHVSARNKAGLADSMASYLAWGKANGVPLFLGEFGVYRACFANSKGGLTWVGDVYDLATGDGAADATPVAILSYHQYHEDAFALYYGSGGPVNPANANQPLVDLLTAKFHTER
jgi:endoglucanase